MRKISIIIAAVLAAALCVGVQAAQPTSEVVREQVQGALKAEAEASTDAWVQFMLNQPIESLTLNGNIGTFSTPAWDPGASTLTGDKSGWLMAIWQNVNQGRVEGSVSFTADVSGTVTLGDGLSQYISAVRRAAQSAKGSFDMTSVRQALVARLLMADPFDASGEATEAFQALCLIYDGTFTKAQLAVALSAQKSQSLGVDNGPQALRMVFYSGNAQELCSAAFEDARKYFSSIDMANALTDDEIALEAAKIYAQRAAKFRSSAQKGDKQALSIDVYGMMTGNMQNADFIAYASAMCAPFDAGLPALIEQVRALPDYPLRDQPESSVLLDGTEGTKLIFRAEDDGMGRYILVRAHETGNIALAAFLRQGDTLTANVPEGMYDIFCAKGVDWYGPRIMFMEAGEYLRTEASVEVLDDTHYHTITLGGTEAGSAMTPCTPEEFADQTVSTPREA